MTETDSLPAVLKPAPAPVEASASLTPESPPTRASRTRSGLTLAGGVILVTALAGGGLLAFGQQAGLAVQQGLIAGLMGGLAGCAALLLMTVDRGQRQWNRDRGLLAGVFEASTTGRAICDTQGRAVFVNRAFARYFEPLPAGADLHFPEKVIASFYAHDMAHAANYDKVRSRAHEGHYGGCELFAKDSSGISHCYLIEAWPMPGFVGYVSWRIEDITPRTQVREAIQREQARWADFMDHAPVGFLSADENGMLVFANATLARWLGCTPRELTGGTVRLHDLMPGVGDDVVAYDLTAEGGSFQQGEFTLKGPGGRQFQAMIAQTVEPDGKSGLFRTRAVVHDLTPEREWQSALQESQARFRRFFEESPIGVALVAEGALLAECNPAFLRMIGADAAQVLAQPLGQFVEAGGGVNLTALLASVAGGSAAPTSLEVRLRGAGDREITAQLYIRRLEADDVTGARLILHFIDLSEQKNLEARFVQSQKMQAIGQLAGGVAHDFNNLLTAMIGFCDLLLLRHKPGDSSFADIMQIKQNANRAAGLVRQLLAFSRQQTLQPRVLNLTDVLVDLSSLLRRLIGENIDLRLVHGRELGLVKADQGQIEQVITNMVVNARDAMAGGGKLSITTSNLALTAPLRREHDEVPPGEWVAIEIADTGTGIPPDIISRIFDPFFSTKDVGKGTGLGLSTCYGIVKQTGGHIFVDSEPGRGTRFTIYLPRHVRTVEEVAEAQRQETAARLQPDLTGAGVILLVEDEDAVRMFAARALKNKGYTVLEARSGAHALDVLKAHTGPINLVVSDVMMPGMDGPTLMQEIRRQRPDIRAIFISGYSEERLKESFETGDAVHFLPKPFSLKDLAEKVKIALQG